MKSEFLQPRFEGDRFSDSTLPLEVARDLAAYENLISELAKRLYLAEHPERQRVPKGFDSGFQLHLERIDQGSTKPLLALVASTALALGESANYYFERARDLVTECIAAPEDKLPMDFPRDLLGHFNQVGRSLLPGERMELPRSGEAPAVLTPERRKNLVLAANTVYERPVEMTGRIVDAYSEKSSVLLRSTDNNSVIIPIPETFHPKVRKCWGSQRHQVILRGVGAFDSWDKLQKMILIDSLEVQEDFQLANRFDELRVISDGWYDGVGKAPPIEKLDFVASQLIGRYPEELPYPAIVPTPEGNLLFEWNLLGDPSVDFQLLDMTADFHAFQDDAEDIEFEFDLSVPEKWPYFLNQLSKIISNLQA